MFPLFQNKPARPVAPVTPVRPVRPVAPIAPIAPVVTQVLSRIFLKSKKIPLIKLRVVLDW